MYVHEGSGAVATTPLRGVAAESPEPRESSAAPTQLQNI